MLVEQVEVVTSIIALAGVGAAVYSSLRDEKKPARLDFVKTVVIIFVLQMLNFPVQEGTSGHFLGGVLAASLLGTNFGILAMGIVVTVQTLVFGDGGITTLGANLFNMAIIGAGTYGVVTRYLKPGLITTGVAAWISVVAASFACGLELVLSVAGDYPAPLLAMVAVHSLTGVAEAFVTLGILKALTWEDRSPAASFVGMGRGYVLSLFLVIGGMLLAPFASPLPDGLEWVAQRYRLLHESMPYFAAPLHDYKASFIGHEYLSSVIAALLGVIILSSVSFAAMTGLSGKRNKS
ncbi:MAG TPA: cobalamin biosynthesis protein CbiM [Syntrophus sp. (in: bacteria)]|jgi:cobalt/nickel transport system permease protein|nr:cobalamin biosynthesis protein CbiM [Syntrophus sp. (in: bacteria)]